MKYNLSKYHSIEEDSLSEEVLVHVKVQKHSHFHNFELRLILSPQDNEVNEMFPL